MRGRLAQLTVAALAVIHSTNLVLTDDKTTVKPRLGLLASSLGVPPVPGASYGGGDASSSAYGGGETGTQYSTGGGGNYGPGPQPGPGPAPLKTCKCVPVKLCQNPVGPPQGGGGVPPYGGGSTGGGNYGGGNGGVVGGNGGGNYGGGNGGVVGGNGGGDYGGGVVGGNGGGGGNYGGGNGGVVGGNGGNYGGSGGLVEPSYPAPHPGVDPGVQPSYGGDGAGTDGAGLIDIRIVNRPPGGPVVCLSGEVYCCEGGSGGPYPPSGGGPYPPPTGPIQGPGKCGVRQFIPVNGVSLEYGQAQFGAYPWMAVMLGPNNNYLGAGALIDSYHVLTAAHKIAEYKGGFKVRLGEWNAAADDEPYKNVEVDVGRVDIHPAFNPQNLQNDVAVITLAQPVSLDAYPHIKSVCLPTQGTTFVGERCYVAGFGKDAFKTGKHSYILREVDVPVVESNECEQRLRGTRLGNYFNLNRKSFLCAGGEEGKDACTGDGGSPLVCEYNGQFRVVGLVAWGIGCADYGIPGVYVNVPNYVNWIESKLETPYSSNQNVQPSY